MVLFQLLKCIISLLSLFFACFGQAFVKKYLSDPTLDVNRACSNHVKMCRKHANNAPQTMKQCYQSPIPIKIVLFQRCEFMMVELLAICYKSTRSPIDMCHRAILSHCCYNNFNLVVQFCHFSWFFTRHNIRDMSNFSIFITVSLKFWCTCARPKKVFSWGKPFLIFFHT